MESPAKLSDRKKATSIRSQEIIEIEESPAATSSAANSIPLPKRRGLATQIPPMPKFKLRYAEKERQNADQRIADRKTKTCFVSFSLIVLFRVGFAYFTRDNTYENSGDWTVLFSKISIDEDNRILTFNDLAE